MSPTIKKVIPHLITFFVLLVFSLIWFKPYVFDGKVLQQSDNLQARGTQEELRQFSKETGTLPLWTNSQFGGMPAYQILYPTKNQLKHVLKASLFGNGMAPPHTAIFLLMAGFYFLMVVLGIDFRLGIAGAIALGMSVYYTDLVIAGHSTKIVAIGFMAPILASFILVFRKKYLVGGGLFALFFGLQIFANHLQITYYFFIALAIFGLIKLINAVKNQTLPDFGKAVGVLAIASLLAVGTNLGRMWTTYEYSQETIRGESELTNKKADAFGSNAGEGGLSKFYAFEWSYGKLESMNFLIPNFMGGSSSELFANDRGSASFKALPKAANSQEQIQQLARATSHYWGDQRFVGTPVYMGAVLIFLFFLGAFLVKKPIKTWLVTATVLMIMFAWGRHFSVLNYTLFDYFPLFNKFRAVSMASGVAFFFVVVLGLIGMQEFLKKEVDKATKQKALYLAGGVTGGLILLALIMSFGIVDYGVNSDKMAAIPDVLKDAIAEDRAGLLRSDAFRSLAFVGVTFGVLWFFINKSLKPALLVSAVAVLILADMLPVSKRFLTEDLYVKKSQMAGVTQPSAADQQIMQDPDLHYRVADFTGNPFANALTSYHHKSMGGYHAAKLMRFQEMINEYLMNPAEAGKLYGMFNTKYFIGQGDRVIPNPDAMGNAWFVQDYEIVPTADAEFAALKKLDPAQKAVIQEDHAAGIKGQTFQKDPAATIRLTAYHPDEMVYQYSASSPQLTVFSEVYYPPSKGWKLYLDGQPFQDYTKVNFILRGVVLPAGQHELKMVFEPTSYYTGETISMIASILVILFAVGGLFLYFKKEGVPAAGHLPAVEVPKVATKKTVAKKKR